MNRNLIAFTLFVCLLSVLTGSLTRADERTDREIKDEFANEQLKVLGEMYSQVSFVSARYQPYIYRRWLPDTSQSFSVKIKGVPIKGVPQLPPHDLTVTFHNSQGNVTKTVSDDQWKEGYAWKVYPDGKLKSNPTKITAKVRLKNSGFWFEETWNVASNGSLTSARHNRAKAKDTLPDDEDAKSAARKFETAIQEMRLKIVTDLDAIDVLNSSKVEKLQRRYSQEIIVLQQHFLKEINHNSGKFKEVKFDKGKDGTYYAEVLGAAVVGGGTGAAIAFVPAITVTATSWVFWTTTSTVAIGSLGTGAAADMFISGGIITATAVVGGVAYYFWTKEDRKEKVRKAILKDFDGSTSPMMRAWANVIIRNALKERPQPIAAPAP